MKEKKIGMLCKHVVFITTFLFLIGTAKAQEGASANIHKGQVQSISLEQNFKNPPPSAKARTWWHWMNGNVTKEGIMADLEAMKKVTIEDTYMVVLKQHTTQE